MHIIIKNQKLSYGNYKVKCSIGKRGIGIKNKEGDLITPIGVYRINKIFYRKDRIKKLTTKCSISVIKKNMGWCDDIHSTKYNKLIKYPFKYSSEKLYRKDNTYDIILVLSFNTHPIRKGRGSAIFIHIAKKNYKKTSGCIAVKKNDLKKIIKTVSRKTKVIIS